MLDEAVVRRPEMAKEIVEMVVLDIVVGVCRRNVRTTMMASRTDLRTSSLGVQTLGCLSFLLLNIFLSCFICDGLGKNLC
jgi:hypothetical protein